MKQSQRLQFLEAAYDRIREELLPEAPTSATIVLGPLKKGSPAAPAAADCQFEVIRDHKEKFGGDNLIFVSMGRADDVVQLLAALLYGMIRHALDPDAKHGKAFKDMATKLGFSKPWACPQPDGDLQQKLRGVALAVKKDLGFMPTGYFVPPPPKAKKPNPAVRLRCQCENPRLLKLPARSLDKGSILCGECRSPFRQVKEE